MPEGSAADFAGTADGLVDYLLGLEPEEATALGDHRFDAEISDLDLRSRDATVRRLRDEREKLTAFPQSDLGREARVDLEMLTQRIDQLIFDYEELCEPAWNPLVYNPGDGLLPLLSQATIPLEDRARGLIGRLRHLPGVVALARRQLQSPPPPHLEVARLQHGGVNSLLRDHVSELSQRLPSRSLRSELESATERALEAWADFGAFLETLEPGPTDSFRLGQERFASKLRLTLHSHMTPADVVGQATHRLDELTDELGSVASMILPATPAMTATDRIRAALAQVSEDRPDDVNLLDEARSALRQVAELVAHSGLFTPPQGEYDVEVMPPFMRGGASVMCLPAGPFEEGARSKVYIAPPDAGGPPDESDSYYRELNRSMMVLLMAHEGVPGHVLQLDRARQPDGPTRARQALWSGTFVEGWASHAERIVVELAASDPALRSQELKMKIRCAINAMLDASVHAGEMGKREALDLMTRSGFQESAQAEEKWRRACITSTQLSTYFVGYVELERLFERFAPIRSYDPFLSHGSPPPELLSTLLV